MCYLFYYEFLNYLIMKKKLLYFVGVAAIALVAGWNINLSQNEFAISDMALANVEALAQESGQVI
jgi:hypothetical protein